MLTNIFFVNYLGGVDVPFFGVFLDMISTKYHGKKKKKKLELVFSLYAR
jgi:hypothetical protein